MSEQNRNEDERRTSGEIEWKPTKGQRQDQQHAGDQRRRAEFEQRTRQEAKNKTRPTTLEEYLRTCHTLFSGPLRI